MVTDIARLRGSQVPLVTPFRAGRFDEAAFRELVEFQIAEGSHGIGCTGTTGEPTSLTPEEREFVIETAVGAARGRVPVLAGTGSTNFDETLRFTRFARQAGADAALVIVPYYNRPSQEGLYRHFRAVADDVPDLPIILYNIPGRSAVNLAPETIARLARDCPNIVGVKEANKDFDQVSQDLDRVKRLAGRGDFLVYSGIETLCFPMLCLGGAGHVSATGNVLPRQVAELFNLTEAGRWREARDLHYELLAMNEVLFIETNPGPVKGALGLMGKIDPELRLPLAPLAPENEAKLRAVLGEYGLPGDGRQPAPRDERALATATAEDGD
ncbi:MAG: 4-hydroxy-tetrahydrodipicolinate synthase [uncultured Thermomicrobiales bacterium]|uniref:4-hydroxy-tetrahydrodipicolinate synthase n=1 Tax=uncultured Thermomicrobiales bacterium TaxID=1645740 RepID=A0A6J4UZN9_9BACT|nr:MAG: 4-hydroxy-tetrahydrodipicolinate synthase [uncultured Thermomicrobiales bacterium]